MEASAIMADRGSNPSPRGPMEERGSPTLKGSLPPRGSPATLLPLPNCLLPFLADDEPFLSAFLRSDT